MTGAALCRRTLEGLGIGGAVVIGPENLYVHGDRVIVLRRHCFHGTSRQELTQAAHEAGHAAQEAACGWVAPALRWIMPGRLWLEWDASRRARAILAAFGIAAHEEALLSSWRAYLVPAIWQTAVMLAVLVCAAVLRGR